MSGHPVTVGQDIASRMLAAADRDGFVIDTTVSERKACIRLNVKGLLRRDKKDASKWWHPDRKPETVAAPSLAPEPNETLAERIANGSASPFEIKTGSRDWPVALRIDQIDVVNRLRVIDPEKVAALKASIEKIGLRTPISVFGDWQAMKDETIHVRLSAGAHRLEAMRQLGREHIAAIIRDEDEVDAELWEIDENLIRSELTPADRAIFIHRRKQLYELKFPETAHGGDRKTDGSSRQVGDLTEEPKRFSAATAGAIGQSERAVQRDAERGEKISEKALRMLRGTRHDKGVTLDRLKTLSEDQQEVYVNALFEADKATERHSKLIRTDKLATKRTIRTGMINAIAERGKMVMGQMPIAAAPVGYCDVPWEQEAWSDETGQDKGLPYPSMSVDELMALCAGAKSPFTPDAILYFWSTTNRLRDAMRIIEAWGFKFMTMITWDKVNIGMGRWVRDRTEHLLICKRGDFPGLDLYTEKPQSLYSEVKTEHSRKPVWFAEQIERLYPDMRKLELFQRKDSLADDDVRRNGNWIFWGNQAEEADDTKPLEPTTAEPVKISVGDMGVSRASFRVMAWWTGGGAGPRFDVALECNFPGFKRFSAEFDGGFERFDEALLSGIRELFSKLGEALRSEAPVCTDDHRAAARAGRAWLVSRAEKWGLDAVALKSEAA
ncbi:MT-A70 family methyltransferase [Rhizobium ruizarguesonis]|uniref:MT-A70 family methyltransferase n=1 Tax=Rhizobium ruizarguesonis TaxID=2081791 RepID=UPI001FE13559|nr:MT-A70 family methyltransferase [Rhizobium ruizarguesonis]